MKRTSKILLVAALCLASAFAGALAVAVVVFEWHPDPQRELHRTCVAGQLTRVRLALARGANINGTGGTTPLSMAAMFNHKDVIEYLLSRGARLDGTGKWQETPLHVAAAQGNELAVESLLAHGADPTRVSHEFGTPRQAADANHQRIMSKLPQLKPN